jgi:hypothetical protein
LSIEDEKIIDSLTSQDSFNLKADSTNSIGRLVEGAEGKPSIIYILYKLIVHGLIV